MNDPGDDLSGGGAGGAGGAGAGGGGGVDRESPNSKNRFKSFYREFRNKEKESEQRAYDFAVRAFDALPARIHWRVAMEVADLAKRQNKITQARKWYEFVNRLQPYAAQGWLESGKMEEECGELIKCQKILETGLAFCPFNESLLAKMYVFCIHCMTYDVCTSRLDVPHLLCVVVLCAVSAIWSVWAI